MNYGPEVLTLFREARHSGTVPGGACGYARGRSGVVEVVFSATMADGRISAMRYGALGCPWVIAACEWACREAEHRPLRRLAEFDAASLTGVLSAPAEKTGSLLVVEDAIAALRANLERAED
ncbi:MAG: hypothetical protein P8172_12860 [Gammaproteobacteria bacterium]